MLQRTMMTRYLRATLTVYEYQYDIIDTVCNLALENCDPSCQFHPAHRLKKTKTVLNRTEMREMEQVSGCRGLTK